MEISMFADVSRLALHLWDSEWLSNKCVEPSPGSVSSHDQNPFFKTPTVTVIRGERKFLVNF